MERRVIYLNQLQAITCRVRVGSRTDFFIIENLISFAQRSLFT